MSFMVDTALNCFLLENRKKNHNNCGKSTLLIEQAVITVLHHQFL